MENKNVARLYRCPECGALCTKTEINKETARSFGSNNVILIEDDITAFFTCPVCYEESDGWEEVSLTNGNESEIGKEEETLARAFTRAIVSLAHNPRTLDNLETYLTYHFSEWVKEYCKTPEDLVTELKQFAEMEI